MRLVAASAFEAFCKSCDSVQLMLLDAGTCLGGSIAQQYSFKIKALNPKSKP